MGLRNSKSGRKSKFYAFVFETHPFPDYGKQ